MCLLIFFLVSEKKSRAGFKGKIRDKLVKNSRMEVLDLFGAAKLSFLFHFYVKMKPSVAPRLHVVLDISRYSDLNM